MAGKEFNRCNYAGILVILCVLMLAAIAANRQSIRNGNAYLPRLSYSDPRLRHPPPGYC